MNQGDSETANTADREIVTRGFSTRRESLYGKRARIRSTCRSGGDPVALQILLTQKDQNYGQ